MNGTLTNLVSGETIPVPGVAMIGRSPENHVVIDDPRSSRRHAMIRKQGDAFWIFDLGSFNGSYLNGARLTTGRILEDGDILSFADHEYRFQQTGKMPVETGSAAVCDSTIALIRSQPVIILVSDIHGFTSLSERLSPDDLARVMGSWYSDCDAILSGHGATVDKFIGDCVLAYWTDVTEDGLTKAAKAAQGLIDSCQTIHQRHREVFESAGQMGFVAGVALHLGTAAYGGMSPREFTLVGDPVNLTFRLEALTRSLGKKVVASSEFLSAAPSLRVFCENLGIHSVKGRQKTVEVWGFVRFPE